VTVILIIYPVMFSRIDRACFAAMYHRRNLTTRFCQFFIFFYLSALPAWCHTHCVRWTFLPHMSRAPKRQLSWMNPMQVVWRKYQGSSRDGRDDNSSFLPLEHCTKGANTDVTQKFRPVWRSATNVFLKSARIQHHSRFSIECNAYPSRVRVRKCKDFD